MTAAPPAASKQALEGAPPVLVVLQSSVTLPRYHFIHYKLIAPQDHPSSQMKKLRQRTWASSPAPVLPSCLPAELSLPVSVVLSARLGLRRSRLAMLFSFRIVAARLNGSLDFFSLETHTAFSPLQFRGQRVWAWQVPAPDGWGAGAVCRVSSQRPPVGLLSPGQGSSPTSPVYSSSDMVACRLTHTVPCAHQKPITALKAAAGRLVTGSQDHTLRVSVGFISWALE